MLGSSLYLDFTETGVRIVKGSAGRNGFRIDGYADLKWANPLGNSLDDDRNREFGRQLLSLLLAEKLKARRASILISREGLITRTTRVPALDGKVLHEFIHASIHEFLPVDLNEYAFDYRIIRSINGDGDGQSYYDLLLGAVPRYMLEQVMQIMEVTDLYLESVDIRPNALLRLFAGLHHNDVAVLDVNANGSHIAILEDRNLLLYADIPFFLQTDEADWQDFSLLLEETRGYLNFFAARHQGQQVEAIYVVGDLALKPHLADVFSTELGLPVQINLDEFLKFRLGPQVTGWAAAKAAANLGMMLRKG
ncbi:MAG: type IV pilus biogenesis protein PilM [Bacillota bacterium]